jgi:hypothetical protein
MFCAASTQHGDPSSLCASAGFDVPVECWAPFRLHDITTQKTILFTVTHMRTSNSKKDLKALLLMQTKQLRDCIHYLTKHIIMEA